MALAIRMWGIAGVLPFIQHPDEPVNINVAHRMVAEADPNPRFFNYPSLLPYLAASTELLHDAVQSVRGSELTRQPVEVQTMGTALERQPGRTLTARSLIVVASVLMIAVSLLLTRRLTASRTALVVIGVALAIHPLLVANSAVVTPDALAGLFATGAVLASIDVAREGRWRDYVVAGMLVGVGAGTKYNVAIVAVSVLAAHLLRVRNHGWQLSRLVLAGEIALLAFLVTTPFALLDPTTFIAGIWYEARHYRIGHLGAEGATLATNLTWLWASTGPLLLLVPIAALTLRLRPLLVVPFSFVLAYFVAVTLPTVRFERNLLPLIPALVITVVVAAESWGSERLPTKHHAGRAAAAVIAVLSAAGWMVPSFIDHLAARTHDSHEHPREWLNEHVRPGSRVLVEPFSPYVDPEVYSVSATEFVVQDPRPFDHFDVVITTSSRSGLLLSDPDPSELERWHDLVASRCSVHEFSDTNGLYTAAQIQLHRFDC